MRYIYHTLTPFFFHIRPSSLHNWYYALLHTLSSSPSRRSQSTPTLTELYSVNPGFRRWCQPKPPPLTQPTTLNPPNHICLSPPLNHPLTLALQSLMTRHSNLTSQISTAWSAPTRLSLQTNQFEFAKPSSKPSPTERAVVLRATLSSLLVNIPSCHTSFWRSRRRGWGLLRLPISADKQIWVWASLPFKNRLVHSFFFFFSFTCILWK